MGEVKEFPQINPKNNKITQSDIYKLERKEQEAEEAYAEAKRQKNIKTTELIEAKLELRIAQLVAQGKEFDRKTLRASILCQLRGQNLNW